MQRFFLLLLLSLMVLPALAQTGADTTGVPRKKKKKNQEPIVEVIGDDAASHSAATQVTDTSTTHKKKKKKRDDDKTPVIMQPDNTNFLTGDDLNSQSQDIHHFNTVDDEANKLNQEGLQLIDLKLYDQARLKFDSVISLYPMAVASNVAYLYRAKAKMGLNDLDGALLDVNTFIKFDSEQSSFYTDARYTLGLIYFYKGSFPEAVSSFSEALKDSTFRQKKFTFLYRAYSLGQMGSYIDAIRDFTRFLNLDNLNSVSSADALFNRGFYKSKVYDYRGASKDYTEALDLYRSAYENMYSPNHQIYHNKIVQTLIQRGLSKTEIAKYDEAVADFTEVIGMSPDNALAYRLRGLAKIKGKLTDDGCLDLSTAGQMGDNDAYNDIKQNCK